MKSAALHDRGYRAYEGARTLSRRWSVVAWRALRSAARVRGVTVLLVIALIITAIFAAVTYFSTKMALLAGKDPDTARHLHQIVVKPYGTFFLAILMAAFAGGGAIADDARAGAFQLYFARPLSREQYLAGKWLAVAGLVAIVSLLPTLLLSAVRLTLAPSLAAALDGARAILLASAQVAVFTSAVVAISSLSRRRGLAQGGFVTLVFVPWAVGRLLANYTRDFWPQLLSIPAHLDSVGGALFGVPNEIGDRAVPPLVAAIALVVFTVAGIGLARRRLGSVEVIAG